MNTEITQTASPTVSDKLAFLVFFLNPALCYYFWGVEVAVGVVGLVFFIGDLIEELNTFKFLLFSILVLVLGFGISGKNSKSSLEEYTLPIKQEIIFEEMFSSTLAKEFIKPNYISNPKNSVVTINEALYSSLYTQPSSMVFPKTESQLDIEDWVQTLFTEIPKHIFAGIFGIDIGKMCFDCVRKST